MIRLIETPFKSLNKLMGGGLPLKTFIGVMGEAGVGKSILLNELSVKAAIEMGKNVLIVNTEEPEGLTNQLWSKRFAEKYSFKNQVFSVYAPNFMELMALHGINAERKIAAAKKKFKPKPAKVEAARKPGELAPVAKEEEDEKDVKAEKSELQIGAIDYEHSKINDYLTNKNVGVIVYDSLSAPFTPLMAGGRQNLPFRHVSQEIFFEALRTLTVGHDVLLLSSNHYTFDPTIPFQTRETYQMKGGKALLHAHKVVLYLEQPFVKYAADVRKLYIVRHPILPDWKHYVNIVLGDEGYTEITNEEVDRLRKEAKSA